MTTLAAPTSERYRGPFWRKDPPVLDDQKRVLTGGMFEKQRQWWDMENDLKLLIGGYGSGKTFMLAKWLIAMALYNAPVPGAYVSPTFTMAKQTVAEILDEMLARKREALRRQVMSNGDPWPALDYEFSKGSLGFRLKLKGHPAGRLMCFSGESIRRMKGVTIGFVGIDEPFVQEQKVLEQSVARCRHPRARRTQIGMTGTPEQLNWGYELVEGKLREAYDCGWVRASTRENLALHERYVSKMARAYDERLRAAYIEGEFVTLTEGQVYYAFSTLHNLVEQEMPTGAELGVGMDFNVNPMAALVFWKFRNERIHVFEEIELPNSDTQSMCALLTGKHPRLKVVYPDASGSSRASNAPGGVSDFTFIERAGLRIVCDKVYGNPPIADRYNAVNSAFRQGRLTVSPKCEQLKHYLLAYSHELKNKDSQKKMSHLLDALGYAVYQIMPVDRKGLNITKIRGA